MENASHDSNSKKFLGKNIFTNAFPLSLANYMHRERDLSIPVVTAYVEEEIIKTRSRGWSTSHATRSRPLRSDVARFVPTSNPASVARPERVLPVHTSARSAGPCGQVCGGRTSLRHPWLPPKTPAQCVYVQQVKTPPEVSPGPRLYLLASCTQVVRDLCPNWGPLRLQCSNADKQ